ANSLRPESVRANLPVGTRSAEPSTPPRRPPSSFCRCRAPRAPEADAAAARGLDRWTPRSAGGPTTLVVQARTALDHLRQAGRAFAAGRRADQLGLSPDDP